MYLSKKVLEKAIQPSQDGSSGFVLDLSLKQLLGLKGVEKFLEPNEIEKLLLSTNYMAKLDQNFHLFSNLRELDVSINHISCIENLDSLQNLKLLNLSNNRIAKIENLEVLKNLEVLDLSMNYIERIENLKMKNLKTLILSGNNISEIENLHHVKRLQNLEIEKNRIEHISNITIFGLKDLKKIVFAYNKIPIEYFDDLLKVLEVVPTLEEINFIGNEITLHKLYKPKIIQFSNIKVLDKLALKDPIKKHFEALRQDNDIKELIEETKKEYLDRMEKESQLKAAALEMIEKQKQQVDQLFDEHLKILQTDMHCFFERAQELKQRKLDGLGQEITDNILDEWKAGVKKSAIEKKQAFDEALKRQQQLQREYLESELTSKKFTDKLYEIAMKRPEIWKEIKLKEQEQFIAEENAVNNARRMNPHADESELRHYQTLANQIQINMIKDVANAVIDYEAKELHDQREKAATVLKHALLKQMVNHYTNLKQNNRPVDEEEEDEEVSQRDKDRMKFETTEEQLKQMLYSKVYKDGKWKNQQKQGGPQDFSNQSLQELLGMEANRKSPSERKGKKKPTKHIKGSNPMIKEEDEDRHYSPYQRNTPPPKIPNYDDDDLERDPFEGNGATYYDEKHVVGEKSGQKIILIPFEENTNMLDGISAIKDTKNKQKQRTNSPPPKVEKMPAEKPKPKPKKKKKDDLQNVLENLDDYDDNGNKAVPTLNIPDYQTQNKPYGVLDQIPEKKTTKKDKNQNMDFEQAPQEQGEQGAPNKPKKRNNKQEPEEQMPDVNEPPMKENKANKKKNIGQEGENPPPPKKSSACNVF